jgi:hypothetical protein
MFSDYTTTRFLVTDRQARYRHEAQQDRLSRLARRRGRTTSETGATRRLETADRRPSAAEPSAPEGRAAA